MQRDHGRSLVSGALLICTVASRLPGRQANYKRMIARRRKLDSSYLSPPVALPHLAKCDASTKAVCVLHVVASRRNDTLVKRYWRQCFVVLQHLAHVEHLSLSELKLSFLRMGSH